MHNSSAQRPTSAGGRKWLLPSLAVVVLGAGIAFAVTAGGGNGQGDKGEGSSQVSGFANAANEVAESAKPVDNPADRDSAAAKASTDGSSTQSPSRTPPTKPGVVPVGEPEQAFDGLTDVHDLMARKRATQAIRSLDRLRRKNPKSAYLAYLQGTLYMQRSFWQDGFAAYRSAIAKDARYREHPQVIRDGVRGLSSKSKPGRATSFLRDTVGAAAIPELERRLQTTSSPQTKSRIKSLLKRLK